jgi:hypothetical protein
VGKWRESLHSGRPPQDVCGCFGSDLGLSAFCDSGAERWRLGYQRAPWVSHTLWPTPEDSALHVSIPLTNDGPSTEPADTAKWIILKMGAIDPPSPGPCSGVVPSSPPFLVPFLKPAMTWGGESPNVQFPRAAATRHRTRASKERGRARTCRFLLQAWAGNGGPPRKER